MDTIVIDDAPENTDVIDLDTDNSDNVEEVPNVERHRNWGCYDDIVKDNKLFGELIEKCLELGNSEGMTRVINRSVIPLYEKTSKIFRQSAVFNKIINKAIRNLELYPHLKFSHIKEMCETVKFSDVTKWKLTPHKSGRKRKRKNKHERKKKSKRHKHIIEIVLSDDSDTYEVPVITLEEFTKDSTNVDSTQAVNINNDKSESINNNIAVNCKPSQCIETEHEKENNTGNVKFIPYTGKPYVNINDKKYRIQTKENNVDAVCISDEDVIEISDNVEVKNLEPKIAEIDKLLVPHKEETFTGCDEHMVINEISKIEAEIATCKEAIARLEEQEVVDNSVFSPYILCENFKAKIVKLYDRLCELTGEKSVKRREVRLKAFDERHQLPLKLLEDFINDNIGEDGYPHFPDFYEVMQCVRDANKIGYLGWSKQQIMVEAQALFTQCGQALQKSRQRREWRDMLQLVKSELVEDPADSDPELMARLQANKRQAALREKEVLDRFSDLHNPRTIVEESSDEDEISNNISKPINIPINRIRITPTSVSSTNMTHKVTKIVHRKNQVVEIVVSKDLKHNDADKNATENPTSPLPPAGYTNETVCGNNQIEDLVKSKDTQNDDYHKAKEKISQISSAESTCETQKNVSEIDDISPYSIQFTHVFAIDNRVLFLGPKHVLSENKPSSHNSSSDNQSSQTNGPCAADYPSNERPESDEPCNSEIFVSNANSTANKAHSDNRITNIAKENMNMLQISETKQIVNTELTEEHRKERKETDINNIQNSIPSHSEVSELNNEYLAHFFKAKVVLPQISIKYESNEYKEPAIKIKEEPCVDIQKELDELGDNFTATVIDIQDPF